MYESHIAHWRVAVGLSNAPQPPKCQRPNTNVYKLQCILYFAKIIFLFFAFSLSVLRRGARGGVAVDTCTKPI